MLSDHAFLAAGAALDAREGSKHDGSVKFANTDARIVAFHCRGSGAASRSTRAV